MTRMDIKYLQSTEVQSTFAKYTLSTIIKHFSEMFLKLSTSKCT